MKTRLILDTHAHQVSNQLQAFEKSFTYPLGQKTFYIAHGDTDHSYFSFFDALGKRYTFVIEGMQQGTQRIQGTGCAILRCVQNQKKQKFWYLCDFKLHKSIRKSRALWLLLIKYLVRFYLETRDVVAVNMSPPDKNKLVKKISTYLFFKKLKVTPFYLYEWSVEDCKKVMSDMPELAYDYGFYTNANNKDIIIDGQTQPIYHLVAKQHAHYNLTQHSAFSFADIMNKSNIVNPIMMLGTTDNQLFNNMKDHQIVPSSVGTVISSAQIDVADLKLSSLEV